MANKGRPTESKAAKEANEESPEKPKEAKGPIEQEQKESNEEAQRYVDNEANQRLHSQQIAASNKIEE